MTILRPIIGGFRPLRHVTSATSTVDAQEIQQFQKLACEWWDEFGPMKPLHSMNQLRVPLIRDGLINSGATSVEHIHTSLPLKDVKILDVGCGGGILSESLARIGATVTGIDATRTLVNVAKEHAEKCRLSVNYQETSIEEHALENCEKYDAVVASEIVEHVTKKEEFINACVKCLKPSGSLFITTISKTILANFLGVIVSENILNLLPKGTHDYEKFIEPHKLQRILEDAKCRTELIHGMLYFPPTNTWHWCSDTSINYAMQAVKITESEEKA